MYWRHNSMTPKFYQLWLYLETTFFSLNQNKTTIFMATDVITGLFVKSCFIKRFYIQTVYD